MKGGRQKGYRPKRYKSLKPKPEKLYYFLAWKPFGMLSQFSKEGNRQTLADLGPLPSDDIYSIGRLDGDSEGLLILTNDGTFKAELQDPKKEHWKEYWVQVEGDITEEDLYKLSLGVEISIKGEKYNTLPGEASFLTETEVALIPERHPPVRQHHSTPWIKLRIQEGKNRQVRRMTAAIGFPTLRLLRYRIEEVSLEGLTPGDLREVSKEWIFKNTHVKIKS
ncbi:pseudouridine synthase [Marinigracilibium pacificum]|uniref:Pseudouridine synthase n=1 Tax=Marinigracilibium pacificum TaxID=2729599 RepID=A0A848J3Y5_9BACT|nr:pseudouridine synthase [Marinigracilibium pacificum]NMM50225.1 pseudouridine synthase [Marinigracilibium pacificum]